MSIVALPPVASKKLYTLSSPSSAVRLNQEMSSLNWFRFLLVTGW